MLTLYVSQNINLPPSSLPDATLQYTLLFIKNRSVLPTILLWYILLNENHRCPIKLRTNFSFLLHCKAKSIFTRVTEKKIGFNIISADLHRLISNSS